MPNQQLNELRRDELRSAKPDAKPLGLVWIKSEYPTMALGLEKALQAKAHVYRGQKPPAGACPSLVVHCSNAEDPASEIERLRALAPDAPCVVASSHVDLQRVRSAIKAGARGYIHAGMPAEQMVRALSLALAGEIVLPRELLQTIVDAERRRSAREDLLALRPRQLEILDLVAEGLSNHQIARRLFVSESTVKQHLRHAYKTLGVKNRRQAASLFRKSFPLRGSHRDPKEVVHSIG
jgi:DNA-binding NarL/FixJ family response regulator